MALSDIRGDVRFLLNDPSTAANNLYSDSEINDAINRSYRQVSSIIRRHSPGYFQKIDYITSSTTTFQYSTPSDFVRMIRLRVDPTGANLSASPDASTAEIVQYVPLAVFHEYQTGALSNTRVYTTGPHNKIMIAPKFSVSGTYSVEMWYEYSPTELTADTSSPAFPTHYHDILVPMASRWLKASKNLDTSFEEQEINAMMTQMLIDLKSMDTETQQFRTALHRSPNFYLTNEDGVSRQGTHGNS